MADRYWRGGTASWDGTAGSKWAASAGGATGASVPTSADDVYFDATSTGTVTIATGNTGAKSINCTGFTGTLTGTAAITVSGSVTLVAGMTYTHTGTMTFDGTGTLTTAGKTFSAVTVDGSGITLTLGGAISISTRAITVTQGTFTTANFNVTAGSLVSSNSNTRTITLGSSTVTLSGAACINFTTSTNLTFNANTSTISVTNAAPIFNGGGQTFNIVTIADGAGGSSAVTINSENTFDKLTINGNQALNGIKNVIISANQTISTTLTFSLTTAVRRLFVRSDTLGTQRTITLNGTLATLADVDFRDIATAGSAGTWTGTRIGDCKGNSGITFTAAKTVYWNLTGTQNWSATGWATTNNGTPAVNNFPLAQDTATFTEAGAAGTVTINTGWNIGTIQMADGVSNRTTAFTLASGTTTPTIYGSVTLFSNLTLTGTGMWTFAGRTTQVITSAGKSFTQRFTIDSSGGTVQLGDDVTVSNTTTPGITLTTGTLDLSSGNRTLSCLSFSSNNSNTRAISFGSGSIALTSTTAATTVLDMATATGFTWTGTGGFTRNMAATATVNFGATAGGTASNAPNLTVNAGSSALTITSGSYFNNVDFTGSTSTVTATYNACGNLILASGGTYTSVVPTFVDSGTITSTGKTLGNTTVNGSGITVNLGDALTLGSTNTLTLTQGTFNASNQNVSTGLFSSSNTNTRVLTMGSGSWTITGTGSVWDITTSTNLTLNKDTANITLSDTSTSARTFAGGGKTYNNLVIGGTTGTSTLTFTGSNTFGTISSTKTVAHTITLPASETTTVSNWTASGSSGNMLTLNSSTPGTRATLTKSGGGSITGLTYLDIKDIAATPSGTWFSGTGFVDSGNNTGWVFINKSFVMLI